MLILKKITTYLILILLFLTSTGSAFGVVYCDHGCLSAIHHQNHHSDELHESFCEDYAVRFDQQRQESDDSCVDFPLELGNGIIDEGGIKYPTIAALYLPFATSNHPVTIYLDSSLPSPKSPPEISQTILVHRNVVLLI